MSLIRRVSVLLLILPFLLPAGCGRTGPAPVGPASTPVTNAEYAARRSRLMDQLDDGALVILGAKAPDADWRFFQSSDFWYLTGVEVPDAALIIDARAATSTLFFTMSEHDALGEGLPAGLIGDPEGWTGIDHYLPRDAFDAGLAEVARRGTPLYTPFSAEELARVNGNERRNALRRNMTEDPWDGRLTREAQFVARLGERFRGLEVRDATPLIWGMRLLKSEAEVAAIRRAARLAVKGHLAIMRSTQPGVAEQELEALFEFVTRRGGAQEMAYYPIFMSGPHHPWGHYHQYDRVVESGDFMIVDAAPDVDYYNADVSTCFPVSGRFSPEQRELYELCAELRRVCLENYRPGVTLRQVGAEIAAWLQQNGYDPTEQRFRGLVTWGGYNHPIGLATHDVMSAMRGPDTVLEPGFVFACDINMPIDETMGLRLEDTVLITEEGCENLSVGLPRTVEEIERTMRASGLLQREPR